MATRSIRKFRVALIATTAVAATFATATVNAQYFRDDFEDGSAVDGNPVTWTRYAPPFDQGTFEVVNGSLVVTPPTSGPLPAPGIPNYWETDVYVADRVYHDVNVLTQFRGLAQGSSLAGITALDTEATIGASGNFVSGYLALDGSTRELRITHGVGAGGTIARVDTPLSHLTDEMNLRFVVSGLKAYLSAWPVGTPEPAPQLSANVPAPLANAQGHVAVYVGNRNTSVPVAFRFVNVVPEPSSLVLAGLAAVAALHRARRQRV